MDLLVTGPKTGRKSECLTHDLERIVRCVQVSWILRSLPPDDRLLESMGKVYRMHRVLCAELIGLAPEHRCPWSGLAMDQVSELQKELFSCDVVKPVYHIEVITTSPLSPECPVVERFFRKIGKLILEVTGHDIDDTLVTCCHIVLLQYLERHHLRPPVLSLSPLESLDILAGDPVSEISVLMNHGEHRLRP